MNSPAMYSTFLLWMMSELFEVLPEVGDMDKPRMIFFFDEAHLLFDGISKALRDKIEQVVKLIRSKGVGIYFITQSPKDIPDEILAQLGNKIQHALRAYTPTEEKAVKAAANSFRTNPEFDTKEVLTQMGTGEALISTLDEEGIPGIVKRCKVLPPKSLMGPISDEEKLNETKMNNLFLRYEKMVDRDSAYEFLSRQTQENQAAKEKAELEAAEAKQREKENKLAEKERQKAEEKAAREREKAAEKQQKAVKSTVNKVARTAGGTIGREIGNTIGKSIGGSFGKKIGGNVGASLGRNILGTFLKL